MRERAEARLLSRVLRVGLVAAVGAQILWSFRPEASGAQTTRETEGRALYEASCSTCHGLQAEGTELGPPLQGVGAAAVDFMLRTGRMPLANPADQPTRGEPAFTPEQIEAIVAYVGSIAPGGPAIPVVDAGAGDLSRGAILYLDTCAACHGAGAGGDSIGGGQIAPSLYPPTAREIAEAIRIGPGTMPPFDEASLEPSDVDAIAAYLRWLRSNGDPGGLQLGRVGAVAEGLIAFVVGLGLLLLVAWLTGSKV